MLVLSRGQHTIQIPHQRQDELQFNLTNSTCSNFPSESNFERLTTPLVEKLPLINLLGDGGDALVWENKNDGKLAKKLHRSAKKVVRSEFARVEEEKITQLYV